MAAVIEVLIRINHLKLESFTCKNHRQEVSLSLDFFPNLGRKTFPLEGLLHGPESSGACCRALSSIHFMLIVLLGSGHPSVGENQ